MIATGSYVGFSNPPGIEEPCEVLLEFVTAADHSTIEDEADTFATHTCQEKTDSHCGGDITFSAKKSDGNSLPSWLSIPDDTTPSFDIDGTANDPGTYELELFCNMDGTEESELQELVIEDRVLELTTACQGETKPASTHSSTDVHFNIKYDNGDAAGATLSSVDSSTFESWMSISDEQISHVTFTAEPEDCTLAGDYSVNLRIQDSSDSSEEVTCTFTLRINAVNSAPYLSSPYSDQEYQVSERGSATSSTFTLAQPLDKDTGDGFTYEF